MSLNLSDHQLNIDSYMHKILYTNLIITTNQKPVIYTHKKKLKKKERIQTFHLLFGFVLLLFFNTRGLAS